VGQFRSSPSSAGRYGGQSGANQSFLLSPDSFYRDASKPATSHTQALAATRVGQISKLMNPLDKLLSKYNWPTKSFSDDTDFEDIEKEIGFELPQDYKDFLSKYVGYEAQIGEESFKLWDKKDLISWNQGYQILENLPRTIGIGDNGGGELIGIERLSDGGLRIVLTPFITWTNNITLR